MSEYIILVRIRDDCIMVIAEEEEAKIFDREGDAIGLMEGHVLGLLPYQVVELEI